MDLTTNCLLKDDSTISFALQVIDRGQKRIAIVVDDNNTLLGTLNDGDIRRAFLAGYSMNSSIRDIYYKTPTICFIHDTKEQIIKKAIQNQVYQIPIVDMNYRFVAIEDLASLLTDTKKKNRVIIMAGGLGTRLQPLTNSTPKPLLKVGNKPILENIINNFASYGFQNITISVNYKSQMIKDYFGDGSAFGVHIDYLEENKKLGTAGALSLLEDTPKEPFFVINGDILTNVNFTHLLDFHSYGKTLATMCVREYQFQIPYGVIEIKNSIIESIKEKPIEKYFVNAGIYVLSPKVLQLIPKNKFFDMPTLFELLIKKGEQPLSFPIHEYWLDIGRLEDFQKAQEFFNV